MDIRNKSVDRSEEMRERKEINPLNLGGSLILKGNEFDINKYLSQKNSIKTIIPKKSFRRKLFYLNKKILSPPINDIISKNSDISTEENYGFSLEKDNSEKYYYLNTESNKDRRLKNNLYVQIKNASFSDRSSLNNISQSSFATIFFNSNKLQRKISPLFNKFPNQRLYPRKFINDQNSYMNSFKIIKEIKKNNEKIKQEEKNADYFKKIPEYQTNVAFAPKYEDIVFNVNKQLNKYRIKENNLTIKEDNIKSFISKNNQITKNNVLIEVMRQKNKKLQNENQNWGKTIQESENILKRDEKDFDSFINKQRDLYFKVDSIAKKIYGENNYLRKLLYEYTTRSKSLEDEIFKLIEQIESIRIYAKFIHKVLEEDEKLFEEEIIPDYENDIRPEISFLIKKVYNKYGYLLTNNKLNFNNNTYNNINSINDEDNNILKLDDNEVKDTFEKTQDNIDDNEFLSDPYIIIRKFKELEDLIIRNVQRAEIFNKKYIKESKENNEIIKEMKNRIEKLKKEYEKEKKALINYKINEFGNSNKGTSEKEFCIMTHDLCKSIEVDDEDINEKEKKKKFNLNHNNIDILELNEEISNCMDIMKEKEKIINNCIANIEICEKKDPKIFIDLLNKRRKEIKIINQNSIKQDLEEITDKKKIAFEQRLNKIIVKSRKCEPPLYFQKKEIKIKIEPEVNVHNENEELLKYK